MLISKLTTILVTNEAKLVHQELLVILLVFSSSSLFNMLLSSIFSIDFVNADNFLSIISNRSSIFLNRTSIFSMLPLAKVPKMKVVKIKTLGKIMLGVFSSRNPTKFWFVSQMLTFLSFKHKCHPKDVTFGDDTYQNITILSWLILCTQRQ